MKRNRDGSSDDKGLALGLRLSRCESASLKQSLRDIGTPEQDPDVVLIGIAELPNGTAKVIRVNNMIDLLQELFRSKQAAPVLLQVHWSVAMQIHMCGFGEVKRAIEAGCVRDGHAAPNIVDNTRKGRRDD